ncbi:PH domain-containing protein [Halobacillus sp. Marseille-Q1614]|uniref:PH domain-containing protein n=1 Tax=Halobacillus sp. Marseille-Q1614 TaxID=2709134 RepID=UPI00156FFCE5|nr:PH domain-containing protein [Halobacillus sp. Marseille-Q1614]
MFEPKRLHPVSAFIHFIKGLKDAILPLAALLFLNRSPEEGFLGMLPFIIGGTLLLFILISGIFRWLRFTYRIEEGELRIEHGLFLKKKRYIPIERIQSLDFSESVFHRPFKLVKVTVETAGSSDPQKSEAELTAIEVTEARNLELLIEQHKRGEEEGETSPASERKLVYQMSMRDIVVMALTSGGAGVVISGVLVFLSQGLEFIPVGAIYEEVIDWLQFGFLIIAVGILLVLLVAYGISVVLTILRYADFSVYLENGDLIITRGLLEKRQVTIPLNRIQGLRIDENIIREPFGFATVTIISAGGSLQGGQEHSMRVLPLIKRSKVDQAVRSIIPEYEVDIPIHHPPKRSIIRYILRFTWFFTAVSIPVSILFYPLGLLSLVVIFIFAILGYNSYRHAGWSLGDHQLLLVTRFIVKQTYVMKKHRIQSMTKDQTIFQKKADLASIDATMKSGVGGASARVFYLKEEDTNQIYNWYSHSREK